MEQNKKANLFIVGAMKAGTTSFNTMLAKHPACYFSPIKEPNFFVKKLPKTIYTSSAYFNIENYFKKKFPQPLHIAHIKKEEHYDRLFSAAVAEHQYRAEGSTAYLHARESAALIYAYNPDAKIIIILRNGMKRAFSHYKMDVGLGRTTATFNQVMQKDLEDYKRECLSEWSYLGMSLYKKNVQRYKCLFGENVLVVSFEELVKNKNRILKRLFSFLEIEEIPLDLDRTNESTNIRFKSALFILKQTGLKDLISWVLPVKLRHGAFHLLKKKNPLKMELPPALKNELEHIFEEDSALIKDQTEI